MKLSIITINYNNAAGLKKTLDSVAVQDLSSISSLHSNLSTLISPLTIEHIIVDGGSTDGSVDVIKDYAFKIADCRLPIEVLWVSEKDKGIYNAMNKGIQIAMGTRVVDSFNRSELVEDNSNLSSLNSPLSQDHYLQILNSGDLLASADVCARMLTHLHQLNQNSLPYEGRVGDGSVDILYGNMIREGQMHGRDVCLGANHIWTMDDFIKGTINHNPTYIHRSLYEKYGLYDENLKICSDWKWFVNAVIFGGEKPIYVPIDVTIFDVTGISETNLTLRESERHRELEQMLPAAILKDYDDYHFLHTQYKRLKKHHLYGLVYFMERVLFKLEKWGVLK